MANNSFGTNSNVVQYFVVQPDQVITGSTGDFYVCNGTLYSKEINGCDDRVLINNNIFYNTSEVVFNSTITACDGVYTSNLYGCSPIRIHDTSYFLKDLYVINGYTTLSATTASTLNLTQIPVVNNSATQILTRNITTGNVEYRDVNTIITEAVPYVTGGTYNPETNIISLENSDGSVVNITGVTDTYVSGLTLNGNILELSRNEGLPILSVDLTSIVSGDTNTYTTGFTYNNNRLVISQNNGIPDIEVYINEFSGLTINGNLNVINSISATTYYGDGSNLTGISSSDNYVTGGTYSNGSLILNRQNGSVTINGLSTGYTLTSSEINSVLGYTPLSAFTITSSEIITALGYTPLSAYTDSYVTGFTYSNNLLTISQNQGLSDLIVNISGVTNIQNLITVGLPGSNTDFNSIKSAVNSITDASPNNTYVVKVGPGVFYEDTIIMKSYVDVVGESETNTIIQANDPNTSLIIGADQSMVNNVQIQGCTGTGVSAVYYSSPTTPQLNAIFYVENVRFGSNYTHAKVVGTSGGNCIMQCSNVKYGGYPFTLGFYVTNDGSGIGRMQLRNVTSTNGGVSTTSGLVFAKSDQPGCAFIVNGALLTKSVGTPSGIGFWIENGGVLRATSVNLQRWSTGLYVPNVGSAPSIDALTLNFEGCTIDVNIEHPSTTGKLLGTDNYSKTIIPLNAPIYEVGEDPRVITVSKKGGDFTSIKSAVDSITGSSKSNRYLVKVGPGIFNEQTINLTNKPYISVEGSDIQITIVTPQNTNQTIFELGTDNELSFMTISGATSGIGISCNDIDGFSLIHKVSMYDNDTHVWVQSSNYSTTFYGEYLDINGEFTYGVRSSANNSIPSIVSLENYFTFPTSTGNTISSLIEGDGSSLSVIGGIIQGNSSTNSIGVQIKDGGYFNCSAVDINYWDYGINIPNIGQPTRFELDSTNLNNNTTKDFLIEQSSSSGRFQGASHHTKIDSISNDFFWLFLDNNDGELEITRKASVTFSDGTHTDFTTLLFEGSTMGLMSGGEINIVSGFTISTATGFGYLAKTLSPDIHSRIDWVDSQITLNPDENKYIYINENGILSSSGTRPNSINNIVLGRVVTNSTEVLFIDLSPAHSDHTSNRYGNLFREAMGPIYAFGSIVTENVTPFNLDITGGEYYYSTSEFTPTGGTAISFTQYYRNGLGGWITSATTEVFQGYDDNSGTLSPLTLSAFTKHTLYLVGDGSYEKYFLVLGQNEYPTLIQTENALLPTPPTFFTDSVSQIANIYIQQGNSNIIQIEDIRPTIGFRSGGVNASSIHGNLLGLGSDDHTQYLLVNGGRSMAGNLDMGGNNISNVNTVDGVDVSSHSIRHKFGGDDPIGSTIPGPNYIPYADVTGTLDSWVSTATTTTFGRVKLSTIPITPSNPIAIGDNDIRVSKSITGGTYSSGTLILKSVSSGDVNITGFTTQFTGGTVQNQTNFSNNIVVSGTSTLIGSVTFTNISGGTYYGDGSNLTGLNIYNLTGGTEGKILSKDSSSDYDYSWKSYNEVIQLQILSEGNTISDGFKGYRYIDKDMTIHKITMLANSAATVNFRVGVNGTTIGTTGLTGQTSNVDTVLSGWTTNLNGGSFMEFNVDSLGTINTSQGVVILIIEAFKNI